MTDLVNLPPSERGAAEAYAAECAYFRRYLLAAGVPEDTADNLTDTFLAETIRGHFGTTVNVLHVQPTRATP